MRATRYAAAVAALAVVIAAGVVVGGRGPDDVSARLRTATPRVGVAERWRVALRTDMVGLPAADRAGVVVTAGESQVVAISPTGKVEWTAAVVGALANAPRLAGDLVFVAATHNAVALRRDDGSVVWSVPTTASAKPNRANRPVVVGEVVVVTAADGLVLGLDRATGAERWRRSLPTATTAEPAAGGGAAVEPVVVIVGIGQWHALDPTTGEALWSGALGLFGTSSPVVFPSGGESMAAVASNERVVAVDARSGAVKWNVAGEQSELYQVPVLAANGSELLVPDHWGRLTAYDPHNGRKWWSATGPDAVAEFGEPVLVAGRLVALPLDGGGPRLASPAGSRRLRPPADGHGVADLPGRGLVVTTWGPATNYVLLYSVS